MKARRTVLSIAVSLALVGGVQMGASAAENHGATEPQLLSASSYGECNTVMNKSIIGGSLAEIPARSNHWRCWLSQDTSRYRSSALVLQRSILGAEKIQVYVDGYYGEETDDAIRKIQARYKITQDGDYGPNTGWSMKWKATNGLVDKWW